MAKAKWPDRWLMTDERMGADGLWAALERLPGGAGVIFRHYATTDRARLAGRVAEVAHARGIVLGIARDAALAARLGAALVHNPDGLPDEALPFSIAVHDVEQAHRANRLGAALAFVSPLLRTWSHPGAKGLTKAEASRIVAALGCPAIALGGVDARSYAALEGCGFAGWAGIDAWLRT